MSKVFTRYFELIFWIVSLTLLATMQPGSNHFSLCFFKWLGFQLCPGCGLGHSISYLFNGNLPGSFSAHPLGIFALMVILLRVYKLSHHLLSKKIKFYAIR